VGNFHCLCLIEHDEAVTGKQTSCRASRILRASGGIAESRGLSPSTVSLPRKIRVPNAPAISSVIIPLKLHGSYASEPIKNYGGLSLLSSLSCLLFPLSVVFHESKSQKRLGVINLFVLSRSKLLIFSSVVQAYTDKTTAPDQENNHRSDRASWGE
jgi:hypothetical protein